MKRPVWPMGFVNFTQVIFRIGIGEVRKHSFSVFKSRKWDIMLFWCVAITFIFECSIVCLEAVARGLDDVSDD